MRISSTPKRLFFLFLFLSLTTSSTIIAAEKKFSFAFTDQAQFFKQLSALFNLLGFPDAKLNFQEKHCNTDLDPGKILEITKDISSSTHKFQPKQEEIYSEGFILGSSREFTDGKANIVDSVIIYTKKNGNICFINYDSKRSVNLDGLQRPPDFRKKELEDEVDKMIIEIIEKIKK